MTAAWIVLDFTHHTTHKIRTSKSHTNSFDALIVFRKDHMAVVIQVRNLNDMHRVVQKEKIQYDIRILRCIESDDAPNSKIGP